MLTWYSWGKKFFFALKKKKKKKKKKKSLLFIEWLSLCSITNSLYCCILLIDPTKNMIKDNEQTSMNEVKRTSL